MAIFVLLDQKKLIMELNEKLLRQIEMDLGLNYAGPFVKGQEISVKNCWHFSTDGNVVDEIFYNEDDFIAGMNRIYIVSKGYDVIILAFSLMDTHLHFILYGAREECNRFMHDYVRRTSRYIAVTYGDSHKLKDVPIHYQTIDTERYLKTAICYTIKNAPVAGIPFMGWDYPWSSGPLYFRRSSVWGTPVWLGQMKALDPGKVSQRRTLRTKQYQYEPVRMMGDIVFPGEYVAFEVVERLFRTCRSYNYFLCTSREDDVDGRGGMLSRLSIPMQEMRQHKKELCKELFGVSSVRLLDTPRRIRLARALRTRYNSSVKQIVRLCGLIYDEVKGLI